MCREIPFGSIVKVEACNGKLYVQSKERSAIFDRGAKAELWREKILHPKTLIEELGVKAGEHVLVHGAFQQDFLEDVKKAGATITSSKTAQ